MTEKNINNHGLNNIVLNIEETIESKKNTENFLNSELYNENFINNIIPYHSSENKNNNMLKTFFGVLKNLGNGNNNNSKRQSVEAIYNLYDDEVQKFLDEYNFKYTSIEQTDC